MKKFNLILTALLLALAGSAFAQKTDVPKAATAAPAAKEAPKDAKAELVDINSADEKALMMLKGIGDVTAKKIIKSRPYGGKDDLVKKKVVSDKVYADIKDQIIAKQKK
jgi:competence protein ComEA